MFEGVLLAKQNKQTNKHVVTQTKNNDGLISAFSLSQKATFVAEKKCFFKSPETFRETMFLNDLSAIAGALRGIKIFDSTSVELQFISTYIYRKGIHVIVPVVFL